ncbi:sugar kinase [Sphingomonas oryzagri]
MPAPAIVVVGEGMLELSRNEGGWQVHYGGDTLNVAIHLARLGFTPAYLTALGTDAFSEDLRTSAWPREGVDTSMILTDPLRSPGLYAITTEDSGERTFTYWRRDSAASALFANPTSGDLAESCRGARLLFFSLISLAILDPGGRTALLDLARGVHEAGGMVAFDGNYRPRLWESTEAARDWHDRAIAVADIGLPTLDDEYHLLGARDGDEVAAHWHSLGCDEVVVKLGVDGCRLPDGEILPPPKKLQPVDTSGAGDAFDAAYLAGRLECRPPATAAARGHELAGWVVMRRGAIPPRDENGPYGLI